MSVTWVFSNSKYEKNQLEPQLFGHSLCGVYVMNEIFTTGMQSVEDSEALVAPFSRDGGAGQSVTLTLSDFWTARRPPL